MNEMILNVISVLFTSVVIPLITYLGIKLSNYLKAKISNEKMKANIDKATEAVALAVTSTMQTYVDSLKKSGNFTQDAQNEAFEKAKSQALALITQDTKEAITSLYGDFNEWLTARIESQVKNIKEN